MKKWNEELKKILQKSALRNGVWMYVMQVFNTIIPLFTLPYITRILGTTQYGVFSIAINIIGYLQVLIEYGFGMSATREVALLEKDSKHISKIFSNVLYSRVLLYICSVIISIVYMTIMKEEIVLCKCILALLICLFGYVVQENWLFQGMQDMKYISIVNIFGRSISVGLIFLFVKTPKDIILYSILYSVSPFLSGIIGFIIGKKKYNLKILRPCMFDIINEMKNGFFVFTTSLSSKVFGAIGITFLSMMASKDVVGCFSAIQKIPNIIMLAWTPISQVLYPISSKRMAISLSDGMDFISKVKRIILPLFGFAVFLIAIFSDSIVRIAFGLEYEIHSFWLIPLLGWLLLGINNNFLGIQTLLASGHDREYSKCFQIGVGATIVINYLFIYLGSGTGAAFAPVISECIIFILLYNEIKKVKKEI